MNNVQVTKWIADIENAWKTKDFESISKIFSDTKEYWESPFLQPVSGENEIYKCWAEIVYQEKITLDIDILAIEKENAILHWFLEYTDARDAQVYVMDGIYQLKFNKNGKCIFFKQWWVIE